MSDDREEEGESTRWGDWCADLEPSDLLYWCWLARDCRLVELEDLVGGGG